MNQPTNNEAGFSLMEMTVTSLIVGPLMIAITSVSGTLGKTVVVNDNVADITDNTRSVGDKLKKVVLRAVPGTIKAKPVPLIRVLQTDCVVEPKPVDFYSKTATLTPPVATPVSPAPVAPAPVAPAPVTPAPVTPAKSPVPTTPTKVAQRKVTNAEMTEEDRWAYADKLAEAEKLAMVKKVETAPKEDTSTLEKSREYFDKSFQRNDDGTFKRKDDGTATVTTATSLMNLKDQTHYVTPYKSFANYKMMLDHSQKVEPKWEPVVQGRPFQSLRFLAMDGAKGMDAANSQEMVELEFKHSPREQVDGKDNDGNGMIDEGRLYLKKRGVRSLLIDNVEVCTFTLEGHVIRFAIRCCRKDKEGNIFRTTIQKRILIRNQN